MLIFKKWWKINVFSYFTPGRFCFLRMEIVLVDDNFKFLIENNNDFTCRENK
jgi:hypothetical protein